jgi:hypothetical protein
MPKTNFARNHSNLPDIWCVLSTSGRTGTDWLKQSELEPNVAKFRGKGHSCQSCS